MNKFKELFEATPNMDLGYVYPIVAFVETNIDGQGIERWFYHNDNQYGAVLDWFEEDDRNFLIMAITESYWIEKSIIKAGGDLIEAEMVNPKKPIQKGDVDDPNGKAWRKESNKFYKWVEKRLK